MLTVIIFAHRDVVFANTRGMKEMAYWEAKYSYKGELLPPSYRIFERDSFLFQHLKKELAGKVLIEIGCLFPYEVMTVLNPREYDYTYIGVDIAKSALKAAHDYVPAGMFVRCSATCLPFKEGLFDIMLSLGVIHHLPGGSDNIPQLCRVLKDGGVFVLTEAVERRTLSAFEKLRNSSSSPREGRLKPEELIRACMESGKIIHFFKNNSIVLGLFSLLIDLYPILQESKAYLRFITVIDQFAIRTMKGISPFFDAGAYFVIFKKMQCMV